MNTKKNRFVLNMETIDENDTLTLIISKIDKEDLKFKGEIKINIYDLYIVSKKKY